MSQGCGGLSTLEKEDEVENLRRVAIERKLRWPRLDRMILRRAAVLVASLLASVSARHAGVGKPMEGGRVETRVRGLDCEKP